MNRAPLAKRMIKGLLDRVAKDPEARTLELLRSMPAGLTGPSEGKRETPLAKRMLTDWIEREHLRLDTQTLEAVTRLLVAGREAWEAAAAEKRARHQALRVEKDLAQEGELRDLQHETRTMAERERQEQLRMGTLRRRYVQAKLKARIAGLRRRFISRGNPAPVLSSWEQLLQALTGNIAGGEDFRARSEEFLAEFEAKRRAEIRDDDPRRLERLAAIDALAEDLRARRDQMMREQWGLGTHRGF